MIKDLLNFLFEPFHLELKRNVGLTLVGSVDEVRKATRRFQSLPLRGAQIIGLNVPNDPSCNFLERIPDLIFLRLFAFRLTNIEILNSLSRLRSIRIDRVAKRQSINLDFRRLKSLLHVSTEWFDGCDSLFEASSLRSLNLMHCPKLHLDELAGLCNLTRLWLSSSQMTEINALRQLRHLVWIALLSQNKLSDFSGLTNNSNLQFLWIEGCKRFDSLKWLRGMDSLQTLRIIDCDRVEDIEIIADLPQIRHVHIHGRVDVVARDFTFLRLLRGLESVVIRGMPDSEVTYWKSRSGKYDLLRADLVGSYSV